MSTEAPFGDDSLCGWTLARDVCELRLAAADGPARRTQLLREVLSGLATRRRHPLGLCPREHHDEAGFAREALLSAIR